jgi:hypothetical protein
MENLEQGRGDGKYMKTKMKLTEYVRRHHSRFKKGQNRKKAICPSQLLGTEFYEWFDKIYHLE